MDPKEAGSGTRARLGPPGWDPACDQQGVLLPGLCGVCEHLGLEEGHRL